MRKLEARVRMLNNDDLKQLLAEKEDFEEKCQRTKWRDIRRRSNKTFPRAETQHASEALILGTEQGKNITVRKEL